jgi:phosphoribosylanthranilate isomerase
MIVKVCGLKNDTITDQLIDGGMIDMIGFNFYPQSLRYVDPFSFNEKIFKHILTVGVFVGETIEKVEKISYALNLDYVQLHSLEDQAYIDRCNQFAKVIKAIGIETKEDVNQANTIQNCSYLLFDKKSEAHGGTGQKFEWSLLDYYTGETPFLIAGGIGPQDIDKIKSISHPKFAGIDINSRFEHSPAVKSKELIHTFLEKLRK